MFIRPSNKDDFDKIEEIYAYARDFMKKTGNPNQWKDNSPSLDLVLSDIKDSGNGYVIIDEDNEIVGCFALIEGKDPTYSYIEGQWLNDDSYVTIHRCASSGKRNHIFEEIIKFSLTFNKDIRIDTHNDNKIMQHKIESNGFIKCGIIYIEDGSPRIAYQRKKEQ